jgi:hypothetical protein
MDGRLRIAAEPLHQLLLAGMTSVQAVPPRVRVRTTGRGWWSGPLSMARPLAWATPLLVVPAAGRAGPAWLKRMGDRELAMPICPGLLEPGWLQAQGLTPHPRQPPLREMRWLLLPEGRMLCDQPARHRIPIRSRFAAPPGIVKPIEAWQ